MRHVLYHGDRDRMPLVLFLDCLAQMVDEKWQYSTKKEGGIKYGHIDCVGVLRFPMYWYYKESSYEKWKMNATHVEGIYNNAVYNKPHSGLEGKGRITENTPFTIGMALFKKEQNKWEHVAIYVGDYFDGYTNAVIEAVMCGDPLDSRISGYVVIRELSESETINGKFTHFGYLRG